MKALKYIICILAIVLVAYHSVYFKKLDVVKVSKAAKEFNAELYAASFWQNKLIPNLGKAIDVTKLITMISNDPSKTFDSYSHALGIGNLRYFLVSGNGIVESIGDDDVKLIAKSDSSRQSIRIATEYIFGNAVRDATGLININEFTNTMDFNNVSAEINKIIRERVLPPFKRKAKKGDAIEFIGAIELNKEHPDLVHLEVFPVEIIFL